MTWVGPEKPEKSKILTRKWPEKPEKWPEKPEKSLQFWLQALMVSNIVSNTSYSAGKVIKTKICMFKLHIGVKISQECLTLSLVSSFYVIVSPVMGSTSILKDSIVANIASNTS